MTLNTVYTISQYMMEGFTAEEAILVREHDILFNQHQLADDWDTLEEDDRFWWLVETLGL